MGGLNIMILKGYFLRPRILAAAGFATLIVAICATGFARPALAADFGAEPYGADQDFDQGTYGIEPRRHPRYAERERYQRYEEPYGEQYADRRNDDYGYEDRTYEQPRRGSLKDTYDGQAFDDRRWRDPRWREHSFAYRDQACVPKQRIRRMLRRAGWRDFRQGRVRGNIGYVQANKRATGEIYELAVDRCTGEVISAACIEGPVRSGRSWRRRGVGLDTYRDDVVIRW